MVLNNRRHPRTYRRVIWYRFSFRRFFGDIERHRIPILCITEGHERFFVWKCGQCGTVHKSQSLSSVKKSAWLDIRTHSGD